jgi:hypothetical protein
MAAGPVISTTPTSFVYEDLVSHVKEIQKQIIETDKILADQLKNKKKMHNELKSRLLTFIDPYGNHLNDKQFRIKISCFELFK